MDPVFLSTNVCCEGRLIFQLVIDIKGCCLPALSFYLRLHLILSQPVFIEGGYFQLLAILKYFLDPIVLANVSIVFIAGL
jgi:hypothetical protein